MADASKYLWMSHITGAYRTAVGPIGLQIATACGKKTGARLADSRTAAVLGHIELPFDVAGIRHYLDVVILEELDADCLIGTDFMRQFNAVMWPRDSTLGIEVVTERISLELASLAQRSERDSPRFGRPRRC